MEWSFELKEMYNFMVSRVPEGVREMVKDMLFQSAEKKCAMRNACSVNKNDLFISLFEVTPEIFRSDAAEVCKELGEHPEKYTNLSDIQKTYQMSWKKIGKAFHPGNMHVSLYVTDRCNQKCIHCAADSKEHREEISKEEWIKIIENIEAGLRKHGRKGTYIWFGGEPTCREDLRELIEYCHSKGYYQSLITNGVNFDENWAKFCKDQGMNHVFVSLDSVDPEKSDQIRGVKGSLEHAKKAIKNSLKYGLFCCCSTTVMKQNIDELQEIKDLVESLHAQPYFRAIVRQRNAAVNWDEVGLSTDDYKKLYEFKYKNSIEKIRTGKAGALPAYEIFEMVPFMEEVHSDEELTAIEWGIGCQACRSFNGIDINGDIFPCGYPSNLKLGNALEDTYEDVMDSQLFKDISNKVRTGKCSSCHHLNLCGGGCRIQAECETGNFFESFSYCWHENEENIREEHINL